MAISRKITAQKEMNPAAPEEKETSSELEQPQKVDDAPGEILLSKEVDEQKITVGMWVLYRPLDLDDVPRTIYSHVIADPSCFKVPLKLNGNDFSQEQLAECPKLRVGLNFSICETKVPRRTGREAFIVCGFECVSGDHVRVFLCSKVTGLFCSVLLPFGWSYPPGEDIDFFTSKLESFKLFLLEYFQIDPTKRNDASVMFSIPKKKTPSGNNTHGSGLHQGTLIPLPSGQGQQLCTMAQGLEIQQSVNKVLSILEKTNHTKTLSSVPRTSKETGDADKLLKLQTENVALKERNKALVEKNKELENSQMQLHQKNDSLEQDLKVVRKRHHELAVSRFSSNKTTSQKKNLKQNKQQKGTYKKESSDSQEQSDSDSSSEISSPADSANESSHNDELKAANWC